MDPLTYRAAGVNIRAGDEVVRRIAPLAASTHRPEVLGGLGAFAAFCRVPFGFQDPVIVSGTDGVGTKLKIAFAVDRHDTVGIDLVAMSANDVVTSGARPLFFLDYFATGKLDVEQPTRVVAGIAEGCRQAGCALLGGETAELPGMYPPGEYDLAGFAVGVAERSELSTAHRRPTRRRRDRARFGRIALQRVLARTQGLARARWAQADDRSAARRNGSRTRCCGRRASTSRPALEACARAASRPSATSPAAVCPATSRACFPKASAYASIHAPGADLRSST